MQNNSIAELTSRIIEFRDARNWKQFHNPKDLSISLVLEATEVLEHFQWKNMEEMEKHVEGAKEEIGDELADTLYWLLLISHDLKIDILAALDRKMKKNEEKYPINKAKGNHIKYTEF